MKRELEEKLWKEFPLLYSGRTDPITQNLMGFGFECGSGWYQLIYNLSSQLEVLIQKSIIDSKDRYCYTCHCSISKHYGSMTSKPGKCLHVGKIVQFKYLIPRPRMFYNKRLSITFNNKINNVIRKLYTPINFINTTYRKIYNYFYYELEACHCEEFKLDHIRATQVKEKYGTLRFYLSASTDEMENIIDEAERLSAITCEQCGADAKLRGTSWVTTLCDQCYEKEAKY
jgi:hypothetical protein